MFKDKRYQEIAGIILLLVCVIVFLSLLSFNNGDQFLIMQNGGTKNLIGPAGAAICHALRSLFGISSYILVLILGITGWAIFRHGSVLSILERIASLLFLLITSSLFFSLVFSSSPQESGGYIGLQLYKFLSASTGKVGSFLIIVIFNLIGLILLGIFSLSEFIEYAAHSRTLPVKIKNFLQAHVPGRSGFDYPQNFIEETIKKKKEPWITKKKIIIHDPSASKDAMDTLKFLTMSDTIVDEGAKQILYPLATPESPQFDDPALNSCEINESFSWTDERKAVSFEQDSPESGMNDEEQEAVLCGVSQVDCADEESGREIVAEYRITSKNDLTDEKPDLSRSLREMPEPEKSSQPSEKIFEEIPINKDYIIPTLFLNSSKPMNVESWKEEIKRNSMLLVNTLAEFFIESRVINVNRGPVITLYEMQIAPGIKVNKIVGLSDDIALALAASRVRVVAPIPGKSAIGIEVPNLVREDVTLGDIVKSEDYQSRAGSLKVALGKDIMGHPVMLDLKKLPHLLIAGATGAGKSVCVNGIITSLIYNYDPNYVRFILVDPKMVELQVYNGIPHLLTPVITDPFVAPSALKWAVYEMERRYRLLSELNVRDIERYNEKIESERLKLEKLPFIVTIIDELADLMMVASKEIEGNITRISQKARAVGIHMVIATQRPSVDIITGIIKANFPARIAFQVPQKIDSRTIIDQNGAEKLLGRGDMLYQSPISSYPVRVQGAYISEKEIMGIVEHLSRFGEPHYIDIEQSLFNAEDRRDEDEDDDALFVEALKIVEETRKASASYLQRRLSIGYNRAARIVELMEERGYVGPQQGSKPREVLI